MELLDAIELLEEIKVMDDSIYAYNPKYEEALDTVLDAVRNPWIPVSEGLPKKDGRYLVTRHDYVTNTEFIDILWYEENLWWNRHSTGNYAVTAWMPLPEQYERFEFPEGFFQKERPNIGEDVPF